MKPISVFIVDDDEDFTEILGMVLERRGYKVELAHSGNEAVEKFRKQDFDITFMDVKLPGKNGVESFLEIRKFKPEAKVVMMTGFSIEQLLDEAVENGAWGVLHKPINIQDMLELLEGIEAGCILIADDDPDFVESIKDLLESRGHAVLVATNGREVVDLVRSDGIDILILDLQMPVLNGLDTFLELKKTGHAVSTIIVTAYANKEAGTIKKLQSLSVSGILNKPFDPNELVEAVERLSDKNRSRIQ